MNVDQILALVAEHGSIRRAAAYLGVNESTLRGRLNRRGAGGPNTGRALGPTVRHVTSEGRINLDIQDGIVIVFSDAHFHPGVRTTMHRALIGMVEQLRPAAVVCNGDAFDGSDLSRFSSIGWEKKPSVKDELDAVEQALTEIEEVAGEAELGEHEQLDPLRARSEALLVERRGRGRSVAERDVEET